MFHSIAALRALAAFWVLAAHCMIWGGWYGVPLPSPKEAKLAIETLTDYIRFCTDKVRGGSLVLFTSYAGENIEIGDTEYVLMSEGEVLAILE